MTVSNVAPVCPPEIRLPAIDAPVGDAPGNGRAHLGPFEIELGLLQRGLGEATCARRLALRRSPRVEFPFGQGLAAHQRRRAFHVERGDLQPGLGALHVGLGLLDRELVGTRIDDEQEVALLDDLAVLEMDGIDETRDPRAHLDDRHRREAAGILVPLGDRLLQRARHRDRRRGRRRAGGGLAVATREQVGCEQQSTNRTARAIGFSQLRERATAHRVRCLLSFPGETSF